MADSKLVIKVQAQTDDAKRGLEGVSTSVQKVGNEIKKTDVITQTWNKSMDKVFKDYQKSAINMVAGAASFAVIARGIKSCVSAAMEADGQAAKTLKGITDAWSDIKKGLGGALLDTISPALENLYLKLNKISDWVQKGQNQRDAMADNKRISDLLYSGNTAGLTFDELKRFVGDDYDSQSRNHLIDEVNRRAYAEENTHEEHLLYSASAEAIRERIDLIEKNTAKTEASKIAADEYRASLEKLQSQTKDSVSYTTQYYEKMAELESQLMDVRYQLDSAKDPGLISYLSEVEGKLNDQIKALRGIKDESSDVSSSLTGVFSTVSHSALGLTGDIAALFSAVDGDSKAAFVANQLNAAANASISYGEGIMKIISEYAGHPAIQGTLIGLASAQYATQLATINAQKYTSMAVGGITDGPTHALIGEGGEREFVAPLSKLDDFLESRVDDTGNGRISLVINVNNGSTADIAESVFYGIERAQKTGYLPRWKYA